MILLNMTNRITVRTEKNMLVLSSWT